MWQQTEEDWGDANGARAYAECSKHLFCKLPISPPSCTRDHTLCIGFSIKTPLSRHFRNHAYIGVFLWWVAVCKYSMTLHYPHVGPVLMGGDAIDRNDGWSWSFADNISPTYGMCPRVMDWLYSYSLFSFIFSLKPMRLTSRWKERESQGLIRSWENHTRTGTCHSQLRTA